LIKVLSSRLLKSGERIYKENKMELSIIIPCFNEKENVKLFYRELKPILEELGGSYEIIYIDDGSTDGSFESIRELASQDPAVKVIRFRKNFGQTAALTAGFNFSQGDIIIPMDGDLQNDAIDIPRFLTVLDQGFDVVSGWRKRRHDKALTRRFPSWLANKLISFWCGVKLHDYGCTMKAYRRSVMKDIHLYGEMHRFIPIYAVWQGAKITEMVVSHRPRKHGKTNYSLNRFFKVILDLIVIKFLEKYSQKPIYLFGGFGLMSILLSFISFCLMIYFKLWGGKTFIQTPLPELTVMFGLLGIGSVLIGLIAEMGTRTYFESQQKRTYQVKEKVNF